MSKVLRVGCVIGILGLLLVAALRLGRGPGAADGGGSALSGAEPECIDTGEAPPGNRDPEQTFVLLDRTASAQTGKVYADAVDPLLRESVLDGRTIWVAGFDTTATTLQGHRTVTSTGGGDSNNRKHAQVVALRCAQRWITEASNPEVEGPDTDILNALSWVSATAPSAHPQVILASDGLANLGCTDLNVLSRAESIPAVAARCRAAQELPDLKGFDISLVGFGIPAGQSTVLRDGDRQWLISFWKEIFTAAGARSVAVAPEQNKAAFRSERPPAEILDADVALPQVVKKKSENTITVDLPNRMLFATNSSELGRGAEAALSGVLGDLQQLRGEVTDVVGHSDSLGGQRYNELLSRARAKSVAAYLSRHGYRAARVKGLGEKQPACPEAGASAVALPARQACNRRVTVVITFASPEGR